MSTFLRLISALTPVNLVSTGYKILAGILALALVGLILYFTIDHAIDVHDKKVTDAIVKLYDQKIADANAQHQVDLVAIDTANKQVILMKQTLVNNTTVTKQATATVAANNIKLVNSNKALRNKLAQIQTDPTLNDLQKDDTMAAELIDDINSAQCDITTNCGVPNEKAS